MNKKKLLLACLLFLPLLPVSGAKLGDANGDGTINAADIVEVVNKIMDNPSASFILEGADVNRDGIINAADIVGIVSIIMSPPQESSVLRNLLVWSKDGSHESYALSNHPKVTFTETDIVVTVGGKATNYALDNVARFTYSSSNP